MLNDITILTGLIIVGFSIVVYFMVLREKKSAA